MERDLPSLIARVKAAAGPDRELDAVLWLAFTPGASRRQSSYVHKATGRTCEIDETREAGGRLIIVPAVTASTDNAIALAELVLADFHSWKIERPASGACWARLYFGDHAESGVGPSPALAVIFAALTALSSLEEAA